MGFYQAVGSRRGMFVISGEPDFIRLVEFYETGAMQGEEVLAGDPEDLASPLGFYPATFVGFMKKAGESAPAYSGTLNFLARVLYNTAVLIDNTMDSYINAYKTGSPLFTRSLGAVLPTQRRSRLNA